MTKKYVVFQSLLDDEEQPQYGILNERTGFVDCLCGCDGCFEPDDCELLISRRGASSIPVTKPEYMLYPLECDPADKRQRWRIKAHWWAIGSVWSPSTSEEREAAALLLPLRDKLLTFGGEEACLAWKDEDYESILERGVFRYGSHAKLMLGRPCKCHGNACDLYESNKGLNDFRINTGYALSKDGMWRCHSWLVWHMKDGVQKVVETTERRIGYFGFEMTTEEAEQFCRDRFY
jgi:hypothetical protein